MLLTSPPGIWGMLWGAAISCPECCCVQGPFRLSQIWGLNEEEKGRKPEKIMLETFPDITSAFQFQLLAHRAEMGSMSWDPALAQGCRAGAGTSQALWGNNSRASSQCHLRFPQILVCRHRCGGLPLKLNLADICYELRERGELMVLPWVRAHVLLSWLVVAEGPWRREQEDGEVSHSSPCILLCLQAASISFYLVETAGLMENGAAVCIQQD